MDNYKTLRCQPRDLIGKTIVAVRMNPFNRGRGYVGLGYDPTIVLNDGSELRFVAQETDVGEYGVIIARRKPLSEDT